MLQQRAAILKIKLSLRGEKMKIEIEIKEEKIEQAIKQLVGIKGSSEQEVIRFILIAWIGEHLDELEKYGIGMGKKVLHPLNAHLG